MPPHAETRITSREFKHEAAERPVSLQAHDTHGIWSQSGDLHLDAMPCKAPRARYRQFGSLDFPAHGSVLQHFRQGNRPGDILALRAFITATQHHDQHIPALGIIHTSTRAEELAHFPYVRADMFHIAQIAALGLFQPLRQTASRGWIMKHPQMAMRCLNHAASCFSSSRPPATDSMI